jgi:hypothetical protein
MRHEEDLHLAALRADEAAESARRAGDRIEAAYFAGVAAALRACCQPTQDYPRPRSAPDDNE